MEQDDNETLYNDHPDYADGFADAGRGEPLFLDASEPYAAGWRAWHVARNFLAQMKAG